MSVIYKNGTYYGAGGGGGEGADTEIIADDFDAAESYSVGDYVVYEGILYKCTTAHTGAWDASDFDDTQVMAEMPTPMPAADMSEVVTPLPGVMSRRFKYSTEEQVVGEWIDDKPVYQKVISLVGGYGEIYPNTWTDMLQITIPIDRIIHTALISGDPSMPSDCNYFAFCYNKTSNYLRVLHSRNINVVISNNSYLILQYTKTTD